MRRKKAVTEAKSLAITIESALLSPARRWPMTALGKSSVAVRGVLPAQKRSAALAAGSR
jgi:hypothetical protein